MSLFPTAHRTRSGTGFRRLVGLAVCTSSAALLAAVATVAPAGATPAFAPATAGRSALPRIPYNPVAADAAFAQMRGPGYAHALASARAQAARMPRAVVGGKATSAWTPLGPAPITGAADVGGTNSGRVTGLAVMPGGTPTLVAATAGGGVWTAAESASPTWSTATDSQPDIAMGAVTVDPNNPNTIYAGTGEDNACGDCFYGDGILKSTDGGTTWTLENPAGLFTGVDISSLAVQPGNANEVWAGTSSGLFESVDGGTTWAVDPTLGVTLGNPASYNVDSIAIDPSSPSTIWVGVNGYGLYKSTDNGVTWTQMSIALPAGNNYGNVVVALAPSSSSTAYVFVGACGFSCGSGQTTGVGMFKTTDGGSTWTQLAAAPQYWCDNYAYSGVVNATTCLNDQSAYDAALAVDPTNPDIVVAAGITAVESTDGGTTWSNLNGGGFFQVSASLFHPDIHAVVFDGSGNLFIGCDGGVFEVDAAAVSSPTSVSSSNVISLNTNLNTIQFYAGTQQASNLSMILAGAQDNGTALYSSSNSPPTAWPEVGGGDGGNSVIDAANPQVQYLEADQSLYGTNDTWSSLITNGSGKATLFGPCSSYKGSPCATTANFVAPLAMVPGSSMPTLWYGGDVVYESTDGGQTWAALSTYGSSDVSAMAFSQTNPLVAYIGFNDGTVQMTTDGGSTWTTLSSAPTNGSFVTHITVDANNPGTIYVTLGTNATSFQPSAPAVIVGSTLTTTPAWTNVTGNLPANVPTNAVIQGAGGLLVANDTGVYYTSNLNGSATTWTAVGTGLPNVQVLDILLTAHGKLLATTHGRGVWSMPFSGPPPSPPVVTSISPASGPPAGGTSVAIAGANFAPGATTVSFGANAATGVSCASATSCVATSPAGSGTVDVTVTTSLGTSATGAGDRFTYTSPSSVTGYHALVPSRICDTRPSQPTNQCTGHAISGGSVLAVTVAGNGGVPAAGSGVTAAVVNVTAVNPSQASYLTVWPYGQPKPLASSINFAAGRDVPNLVTVALPSDGKIDVYNAFGTVDVLVDVAGYYAPEATAGTGLYNALTPARICDTRSSQPTNQCTNKAPGPGGTVDVTVAGNGGVPTTGVAAVVLNVTAIGSPAPGYLSVYPKGATRPGASSVNYSAAQNVPNRVMVLLGTGGAISIYSGNGAPDIAVDVSGWFTDSSNASATGGQFTAAANPSRICDTRPSQPNNQCTGQALAAGSTLSVTAAGAHNVPANATAVVVNVTAAGGTQGSYFTVFPTGKNMPVASDVNFGPAEAVANMTVATLGTGGAFSVFNANGSVQLIVDLVGWYS